MKRKLTISALIIMGLIGKLPAGTYSGGSGTEVSPYQISTKADLKALSAGSGDWSAYFEQTADITFQSSDFESGGDFYYDGKGFLPIAFDDDNSGSPQFTGNYDGGEFKISNLYINRPNESNVGLFSHLGHGAVIENLGLTNVDVKGGRGTGSLVGRVTGYSDTYIQKCFASIGTVVGDGATGGLVGSNNSSVTNPSNRDHHPTIQYCYANIDVSWSKKEGSGADKIAGLSGCNQKGIIINSYALGSVTVDNDPAVTVTNSDGSLPSRIGGLAGCIMLTGYIENSYSTGLVSTSGSVSNVGGFVGKGGTGGSNGDTEDCFWDKETSDQASSSPTSGCTGKTTAQMKTESLTSWSWSTEIWERVGYNYPRLIENRDASLSVELSSFTAEGHSGAVFLNWSTESEIENLGFILSKKLNVESAKRETVASYLTHSALEGHGSTTEKHEYQFTDKAVQPGMTYEYRLGDVDYSGAITWHKTVEITVKVGDTQMVTTFGLHKAYPNPFNPSVTLSYGLEEAGLTTLQIYNMRGQLVETLVNEHQLLGTYDIRWQPVNLSAGLYIIRLQSGNKTNLQKIVFVK